ncbi:transcriptional regulator family: Fungal Specific TF [Aspergillus niger]|nr:transcriptional regulator family: Fungal Specific TF [Aspergillus niger]KAI2862394.1 transcriptional regulator family: Fungal Specific TF [Aspergillus niger]KAI2869513.1 transcriptional regulator family: Fungal Specific TF [Aspergillus niger]KAI3063941.1 transcriptional regulator family: Fungal Specific TF [Aspergillus niger]
MGGIPFTSRACAACKKRKIKCDLEKPECSSCVKRGGTPCPGYHDRDFIHHKFEPRRVRNAETKRPGPQRVRQLESLALPACFNMSAEARTQLFATYMHTFFASNPSLNGRVDSWYLLMARFPTLTGKSDLLDRSVIGLVSVYLGKKTRDGRLAHHGFEIYNSALHAMLQILQGNRPPTATTLYSAIVFQTYETMGLSETLWRNCLTHIQGATAMLKQHDYTRGDQALIDAILRRHKWATAMFTLNTPYSMQVDEECLNLGRKESPVDELFGIIAEAIALRRDLYWLHMSAHRLDGIPTPCSRRNLGQEPSMLPLDPDLAPYNIESLEAAKIYLLFWVASLVIRRVIYQTETHLMRGPDPSRMVFYAREICRSVAYLMQPENRMSSGQILILGLSQASKCYIDCGDKAEFEWCQAIYPFIAASGFGIASLMGQMEWKFWNAAQSQPRGSLLLLPEAVHVSSI